MLSLMQFSVLPITFIVPIAAAKMKNQRALAGLTALFFLIGIAGVLFEARLSLRYGSF